MTSFRVRQRNMTQSPACGKPCPMLPIEIVDAILWELLLLELLDSLEKP
jgi:hypothetical protein